MIAFTIGDSSDNSEAWIKGGGRLCVDASIVPQNGTSMQQDPFREFFTNSSDSSDMRVDGSSTPVDFNISADDKRDKYVKTMAFELTDVGNGDLNEFGNTGGALSNGVTINLKQESGDISLHEGIKTNYQLVQAGGFRPTFGSTTDSFRASNVNATSEGWSSFIDFKEIYGLDYGMRIPAGTTTTLTVTINDNLSSGITSFNCVATGFLRNNEPKVKEI